MEALLKFLPIFEQKGKTFGGMVKGDGFIMLEWWQTPEVSEFVDRVYADGWMLNGWDWPQWQKQAEKYFYHPELIARARLLTLRKLIHLHLRKDHFCSGHLVCMLSEGQIQAILRRIKKLHE
jgi:O-acetyl-ADP-ribose deacetylase